jgi:hypothetical protein
MRIDSTTHSVVCVVNRSAASTPVYFSMTGAAAESVTASLGRAGEHGLHGTQDACASNFLIVL